MKAAKGALLPLAPRRVRVNAVSPGLINTPAYSKLGRLTGNDRRLGPRRSARPRGAPAEIAEAVAFLASDAAGCITGDDLLVSGRVGVHCRA